MPNDGGSPVSVKRFFLVAVLICNSHSALENEKPFSTSAPVRRLDVRKQHHGRGYGRIDGWWSGRSIAGD
jgi:hypothetical protein